LKNQNNEKEMINLGGGGATMSRIFDENVDGVAGGMKSSSRKGLKDGNLSVGINTNGSFS